MKRRDFVSMLIGCTVAGRLIVPNRRIFLPPRPPFRYRYYPGSGEHTVWYLGKFDSSLRDVSPMLDATQSFSVGFGMCPAAVTDWLVLDPCDPFGPDYDAKA